jgi:mRNA interferase MazF
MVKKGEWCPDRGDLIWLDFNPQSGSEQAGKRPALVVSPAKYNLKVGLALVCPVTTRAKGYPFEVALPEGSSISGVILADQLKSLDWRTRHAEYAGRVPEETVNDVLARIATLLG